jgi:hypothetical protein
MPSKPKAENTPESAGTRGPESQLDNPNAPDQLVVGEPEVGTSEQDRQAADELTKQQAKQQANPNAPTYTVNPTPLDENGNPV